MRGKLILIFAVLASGLLIAGCDTADAIQPEAGQKEFRIEASGDKFGTFITIYHSGGKITKDAEDVFWFYDVPEEINEYAVIMITAFDSPRKIMIHLHESKKPDPD